MCDVVHVLTGRTCLPIVLLLVASGYALGGTPAPPPTPGSEDPYLLCSQTQKPDACADRVEARFLEATMGRAERAGRRLLLRPSAGRRIVLDDNLTDTESYVRYRYRLILTISVIT